MNDDRLLGLRLAVAVWAFAGLVGIPTFVFFDVLRGWRWSPYNAIYDQMIVSVYFALGVVALFAIREPLKHTSFLWFIVLSSILHGGVMLFHAAHDAEHHGHLAGDVWILAGAAALAIPLLRASRSSQS